MSRRLPDDNERSVRDLARQASRIAVLLLGGAALLSVFALLL